ncbi:MAG: preprotein translocase subunit YajC [Desulfovibrio sp.]
MFFDSVAHAMGSAGGDAAGAAGPLASFLPLILMFAIFYFLLIRPQQKKAKEQREMLGALKKGDSVLTGGGIYGEIVKAKEDVLTVQIAEGVKIKVNRNFVSTRVDANTANAETTDKE